MSKYLQVMAIVALAFAASGCKDTPVDPSPTGIESRKIEEGEMPMYPEIEAPVFDQVQNSETAPSWFTEPIAQEMITEAHAVQLEVMTVSFEETEVVDARSDHIAEACSGERGAYIAAAATFTASAIFTVGSSAFGNIAWAWNGLRASAAALTSVNVARGFYKSCEYREGLSWDRDHPNG